MTYSASGTVATTPAPSNTTRAARPALRLRRLFISKLRPGTGTNCIKAWVAQVVNLRFRDTPRKLTTCVTPMRPSSAIFVFIDALSINLSQNDIQRSNDGDHVGNHLAARDVRQRRKIHKTGAAKVNARRLRSANRFDIDAEFAFRTLNRLINLTGRHIETLGDDQEVMNQRVHVRLH